MQNMAKTLESASYNNAHQINLASLLNDYLMHMSHGKGSPTYTIVGESSFMIRELASPQNCISSLRDNQKDNLINRLCHLDDSLCFDYAADILHRFETSEDIDIGSVEYLNLIVKNNITPELGPIFAMKFNYALYCDKLWGDSNISNQELGFCCENLDKYFDMNGSCVDFGWWQLTLLNLGC